MVDLSKISDDDLYIEYHRREDEEEARERKKKRLENTRKMESAYRNRPTCPIVGKAYGAPWHVNPVKAIELGSVHIKGNAGTSYRVEAEGSAHVQMYFHNIWTREMQEEFGELLNEIASKFIHEKVQDPVVVVGLMALSSPSLPVMNPQMTDELWAIYNPVEEAWVDEAVKMIEHLSDEDLFDTGVKLIEAHETGHGQLTIVVTLMERREMDIPNGWLRDCWGHSGTKYRERYVKVE